MRIFLETKTQIDIHGTYNLTISTGSVHVVGLTCVDLEAHNNQGMNHVVNGILDGAADVRFNS